MNATGEQKGLVAEYFISASGLRLPRWDFYAFMGWFFGMQNAIYPLILTVVINVVNIVLSLYFVQNQGMDVDGWLYGRSSLNTAACCWRWACSAFRYGYLLNIFSGSPSCNGAN